MPTTNLSDFVNTAYTGFTGSRGEDGFTGSQGYSGSQGVQGVVTRTDISINTVLLNDEETTFVNLTGFKSYFLYKVQTSTPAWVRVYINQAARTNDAGRTIEFDPDLESGVITDVITTSIDPIFISPAVVGYIDENPPSEIIPISVTNKSGATTIIELTLTLVSIEYD